MHIYIHDTKEGKDLYLPLPTFLVLSDLIARIGGQAVEKYAGDRVSITQEQMRALFRAMRQAKKKFGSFVMVDVREANGSRVRIKL